MAVVLENGLLELMLTKFTNARVETIEDVDGSNSFTYSQWGKIPTQSTVTYAFATTSGRIRIGVGYCFWLQYLLRYAS